MNLQEIKHICHYMGIQAGKWEENEEIHEQLARESYEYIINKCKQHNFKYTIQGTVIRYKAEEHNENIISVKDIDDINITSENYHQFDGLATDIADQLIEYLATNKI